MTRILLALASCLLCMLQPLRGQGEPDKNQDAVKEFRRFFRSFKEVKQKVEAIYTLKGLESAEASAELIGLLENKTPEVRDAAKEVLATYGNPKTYEGVLAELPAMKSQELRAQIIDVLGRAHIKEAIPVLEDIARTDKKASSSVRYEIARALARLGASDAGDVIKAFLADKDSAVRMAAADAAGELRLKDLGAALVALFNDPAWQVQSAAVHAAAKVRPQEAVMPLIELMRKPGRVREEVADALFRITTKDFGTNPDEWEKQMKTLMGIGWRIPTDAEVAKAEASRKKSAAFYGVKEHTTFGGITTTSTQVLFIIDVSGSMDELVVERQKFDAGYENFQKLTIVKAELVHTIENLSANTFFNIIAFATDLDPWKKYLVPANITYKQSAVAWVKKLKAIGGTEDQEAASAGLLGTGNLGAGRTNTYKALMFPFGIDPDHPPPPSTPTTPTVDTKSKLDTVFFLSDGRPSTGKLVDTNEILKAVTKENETARIVIHSIAIGQFQKDFLRSLAERNGGVFVDLGQ